MNKNLNFTKFITIAIAFGFISPTITTHSDLATSGISEVSISIMNSAEARENKKINRNKNKNVTRNKNKNTNVNVNKNKNVNVNVNHNNNNRRGGILAGMVIGTIVVSSAMSPSCTTVIVNGISYRQCDGTYFQQSGPDYIIVKSPY